MRAGSPAHRERALRSRRGHIAIARRVVSARMRDRLAWSRSGDAVWVPATAHPPFRSGAPPGVSLGDVAGASGGGLTAQRGRREPDCGEHNLCGVMHSTRLSTTLPDSGAQCALRVPLGRRAQGPGARCIRGRHDGVRALRLCRLRRPRRSATSALWTTASVIVDDPNSYATPWLRVTSTNMRHLSWSTSQDGGCDLTFDPMLPLSSHKPPCTVAAALGGLGPARRLRTPIWGGARRHLCRTARRSGHPARFPAARSP